MDPFWMFWLSVLFITALVVGGLTWLAWAANKWGKK